MCGSGLGLWSSVCLRLGLGFVCGYVLELVWG